MSQSSVIQILKINYPKWMTVTEIAETLKVMRNSISTNLRRLRKDEILKWRYRHIKELNNRHILEYQYKKGGKKC